MKKWERKALDKGYIKYSFPYSHYKPIYKDGYLCHKTSEATDDVHLYQIGFTPCGKMVLATFDEYAKIYDVSKWLPISVQTLDPEAPLTSELASSLIEEQTE